jgi:ubiquitin thioesterase OTU1
LHYDALTIATGMNASETSDVRSIDPSSPHTEEIMAAAKRLVARYHAARQFTDTANFTLRCGVCKQGLRGEKEAVAHAQATGHASFTEY